MDSKCWTLFRYTIVIFAFIVILTKISVIVFRSNLAPIASALGFESINSEFVDMFSSIVAVLAATFMSLMGLNLIASRMLKTRWGRRKLLREQWLEGYWYLATGTSPNTWDREDDVNAPRLMHIHYDDKGIPSAEAFAFDEKGNDKGSTISHSVYLDGMRFSNSFGFHSRERLLDPSQHSDPRRGIAEGRFEIQDDPRFSKRNRGFPNFYSGTLNLWENDFVRHQSAWKATDAEVKAAKERASQDYPGDNRKWRYLLLMNWMNTVSPPEPPEKSN